MFGAHILGHVLDLSSGMCSRLRLEGVPRAHGVEHCKDSCCRTCSRPMLWDVFRARVVGRVPGPCCRTCSAPMLLDLHGFDYLKEKVRHMQDGHTSLEL